MTRVADLLNCADRFILASQRFVRTASLTRVKAPLKTAMLEGQRVSTLYQALPLLPSLCPTSLKRPPTFGRLPIFSVVTSNSPNTDESSCRLRYSAALSACLSRPRTRCSETSRKTERQQSTPARSQARNSCSKPPNNPSTTRPRWTWGNSVVQTPKPTC